MRFHALLRPLNCGPRATYLVEFSMALAVYIIHSTWTSIHVRYDNPAKCPRALVRFVVANVACSYCLLQIISTCIGPYRLAQQTQVLQEGHFTPYDHVFTLCQQMHTEPSKCGPFGWFRRETDRETDREMFGSGFVFFRFLLKDRPKPTDFLVRNRKTDRPSSYFRFTTLVPGLYSGYGCCHCASTEYDRRSWG